MFFSNFHAPISQLVRNLNFTIDISKDFSICHGKVLYILCIRSWFIFLSLCAIAVLSIVISGGGTEGVSASADGNLLFFSLDYQKVGTFQFQSASVNLKELITQYFIFLSLESCCFRSPDAYHLVTLTSESV